jgi:hypothetical protein
VTYAKAFLDLQVEFAERVVVLSGLPLARALLEYTNLYIRFGLGRDFDPAHPAWREYVAGLRDTSDIRAWTYRFYSRRPDGVAAPALVATFGCFAYSRPGGERLRLHFQNAETDGQSPLAAGRAGRRRAELAALFEHVRRTQREPLQVVGASWLYNLDAYRRLFPTSYLATAQELSGRFQHIPLWGQFLDRHGAIREDRARHLQDRLARQAGCDDLEQCFPFRVISAGAPVQDFYDFYGI